MTEKQKQAIQVLNRIRDLCGIRANEALTEEEYFLLLDFIVGNNPIYVPSYPTYPNPYITWYSKPIPVTCNTDNVSTSGDLTFMEEKK